MKYVNSFKDFLFVQQIVEKNSYIVTEKATAKDVDRINSLVSKAKGNEAKEIQFAVSMANSIKGKEKALTRYEAALELLGKDHPAVTIFGEKAIDLGNDVDLKAGPKVKIL